MSELRGENGGASMDLISRQAAIEALKRAEALTKAFGYHNVIETIRDLPTAEKRGKWIDYCGDLKCDQCGCEADLFGIRGEWNYCPNCGARMEE